MIKMMIPAIAATMIAMPASAKPSLRDVPAVYNALLAVGLADEIRNQCPNITARYFKALRFVYTVRDKAREMGYSDAEIEAYRSSDAEKAHMKAEGDAYLSANGVTVGNKQSYCTLGRAEIKKSSQIGALLRVN